MELTQTLRNMKGGGETRELEIKNWNSENKLTVMVKTVTKEKSLQKRLVESWLWTTPAEGRVPCLDVGDSRSNLWHSCKAVESYYFYMF